MKYRVMFLLASERIWRHGTVCEKKKTANPLQYREAFYKTKCHWDGVCHGLSHCANIKARAAAPHLCNLGWPKRNQIVESIRCFPAVSQHGVAFQVYLTKVILIFIINSLYKSIELDKNLNIKKKHYLHYIVSGVWVIAMNTILKHKSKGFLIVIVFIILLCPKWSSMSYIVTSLQACYGHNSYRKCLRK